MSCCRYFSRVSQERLKKAVANGLASGVQAPAHFLAICRVFYAAWVLPGTRLHCLLNSGAQCFAVHASIRACRALLLRAQPAPAGLVPLCQVRHLSPASCPRLRSTLILEPPAACASLGRSQRRIRLVERELMGLCNLCADVWICHRPCRDTLVVISGCESHPA